jgi:hypothetical protein
LFSAAASQAGFASALALRLRLRLAEAFSRVRLYARNGNFRLTDVAHAAIDGTLDPLAWGSPPVKSPDSTSS